MPKISQEEITTIQKCVINYLSFLGYETPEHQLVEEGDYSNFIESCEEELEKSYEK